MDITKITSLASGPPPEAPVLWGARGWGRALLTQEQERGTPKAASGPTGGPLPGVTHSSSNTKWAYHTHLFLLLL